MNRLAGHELKRVVRMYQWSLLLIMCLISLFTATIFGGQAKAHPFLNSAEPQCNGNDPTILMCDDYEDGTWFVTNADTSGGSGNPKSVGATCVSIGAQCVWLEQMAKRSSRTFVFAARRRSTSGASKSGSRS